MPTDAGFAADGPPSCRRSRATLQAALVDLAGALTIRNGRLVRPLSHSGFGPRPREHRATDPVNGRLAAC